MPKLTAKQLKDRQLFLDAAAQRFAAALAPTVLFDGSGFDPTSFATSEALPGIMDEAYRRAALLWDARERQRSEAG